MVAPLERRFVLVTGKGGVGKSTLTAMLALRSAREGARTLVCELNTRERIPSLFDHRPVGGHVSRIAENLFSVNIQPALAMEEYALMKLRFRAIYHLAFNHERECGPDGHPVWDRIIVDAPATGHGVTFFKLPRVIRDAVGSGNMHQEADDMWSLLTDPERTAVHLVSLPEELPVRETTELHRTLGQELGMPLGYLFVNKVPPPLFDPGLAADFALLAERPADPDLGVLWESARIRLGRERAAAGQVDALRALGLPLVELPTLYTPRFGPDQVAQLAERLEHAA